MKARVGVMLAVALALPAIVHAQWPHLAGQPLRTSAILTDADGFVYVVNPDSDSVTKLTGVAGGSQTVVWEATVGDYPRTLTLWGTSIFTANQGDDTISRIATDTGAPQGNATSLGFGCAPYGISSNHSGDRLYVACQGSQELVVLDGSLAEVARIELDWPMPRAIAVSSDDKRVYVSHFLTVEPNDDAHVSEIDADANALTARRYLTVPADRTTCETQNSGQGVTNNVNAIALTPPESPLGVKNQLWIGGTLQNNLTKGIFRRHAWTSDEKAKLGLFDIDCPDDDLSVSCRFEAFPRAGACQGGTSDKARCDKPSHCPGGTCVGVRNAEDAKGRNRYKASFHDITRFVIWKIDLDTGNVVGKVDVDEANHATDFTFSRDGTTAYVVDQMFHSVHVLNTQRGQGSNPATAFASVAKYGPFSADPSKPCDADALGSVTGERPFILPPQGQITPIDGGNPFRMNGTTATVVNTGVEFNVRKYHATGAAEMRPVPDAIGTAPIGIVTSPNGCVVYVANYLARNVVPLSAVPTPTSCSAEGTVGFRCSRDPSVPCSSVLDCQGGQGFCNHPGGKACANDADCAAEPVAPGPCVLDNSCVPLLVGDPVQTTNLVSYEVPAEVLDGKILFNTAARDASVPNGVGLGLPAPLFNSEQQHVCSNDQTQYCSTSADCGTGNTCDTVMAWPGEVTSTAHDASYVTCTACHVDYGGQDGRTWDFAQFGASLRNTMDLRGRSAFAPGTCQAGLSADAGRIAAVCHFDAECGTGSGPGACAYGPNEDAKYPAHVTSAEERARFFNPMGTVHWNGDRMEVEGFEFTYRALLGAGDCDGLEHDPDKCLGGLLPRSLSASTARVSPDGSFDGDLRLSLRNVMIQEPTLGREVNASVRLTHMADFVYSLTRFPRNPNLAVGTTPSEAAVRGRSVFNDQLVRCGQCHNGPSASNQLFTDKGPNPGFDPGQAPKAASNNPFKRQAVGTQNFFDEQDPEVIADADKTFQNATGKPTASIPASRGPLVDYVTAPLNDVWNTAPYLHDGSAPTLLDVVRPCNPDVTDCNQKGLGRNLKDQHGVTSQLTPQQLNDLVEYQKAPHNPVSTSETGIKAGGFVLKKMLVDFGKKAGRGAFTVSGLASAGTLPVDPKTGGLAFTMAVPGGEKMVTLDVNVAAGSVKGKAKRFSAKGGGVTVVLSRGRGGTWRVLAKGRKVDLSTLQNGARDFTVAVVAGTTQFVNNRVLVPKGKKSNRVLVLKSSRRRG